MISAKNILIILLIICILYTLFKLLNRNYKQKSISKNNIVEKFNTFSEAYPAYIFICGSSEDLFNGLYKHYTYSYSTD